MPFRYLSEYFPARHHANDFERSLTRRELLGRCAVLGTTLATSGMLSGFLIACQNESIDPSQHATLELGTEIGMLNFLYAVSQLEVDFYTRATSNIFPGMTTDELAVLQTAQDTTREERDTLLPLIPRGRIADALLFRLGQVVNYSNRTSVLTHAQTIEDAAASGFAFAAAASAVLSTNAARAVAGAMRESAASRAHDIRALLGLSQPAITPQAPSAVMTTLVPYYYTTFTVTG